jgi:hypothetical protein
MELEEIENEIPFIEDYKVEDIKVLFAYIIEKLNLIEDELQELKNSL